MPRSGDPLMPRWVHRVDGQTPNIGGARLIDMSKEALSVPPGPMSERALWVWLLLVSGIGCWLIAAVWLFHAHLESDTSENIDSGYGLGFFLLGLAPLGLALVLWLRTVLAGKDPTV
jgi:drug/metabolite transporter (DMT)-like permease